MPSYFAKNVSPTLLTADVNLAGKTNCNARFWKQCNFRSQTNKQKLLYAKPERQGIFTFPGVSLNLKNGYHVLE